MEPLFCKVVDNGRSLIGNRCGGVGVPTVTPTYGPTALGEVTEAFVVMKRMDPMPSKAWGSLKEDNAHLLNETKNELVRKTLTVCSGFCLK
jgi:hypothetical protein